MKRETWLSPYRFSPDQYERELLDIYEEIRRRPRLDAGALDRILVKYPKDGKAFFSKSELVRGFRYLAEREGRPEPREVLAKLRMKPIRTLSGVAPVTVLTLPYPCPGECIFCPNDVRMPKSYLSREPGAQRAAYHRFDPYRQTFSRLRALESMGHPVEKTELIILGGTWSSYPLSYQIEFVRRCFEAMNEFGAGRIDAPPEPTAGPDFSALSAPAAGRWTGNPYNRVIGDFLREHPEPSLARPAAWEALFEAQRANESARVRCIGLSVETRPDSMTEEELLRIRRLGATKVQIGYQSLSDEVLALNRRGHDVAALRRATRLLRRAGFKIQAHWMPNLYGSTPARDLEDFDRIFSDPDFRPDELKVYPCSLIESAELMTHYASGRWRPYSEEELVELLLGCLERVPPYCRVSRVVRDIPGDEIVAGNKITNLRDVVERELAARGARCRDIRSREIRDRRPVEEDLRLDELAYSTSAGTEFFLQIVDGESRIAGFARLCLPEGAPAPVPELTGSALLREVHVYGAAAEIGERNGRKTQHLGLGTRLTRRAEELAFRAGYRDLAVISSVGTREYYRRLGFADGELYQHRARRALQEEPAHREKRQDEQGAEKRRPHPARAERARPAWADERPSALSEERSAHSRKRSS